MRLQLSIPSAAFLLLAVFYGLLRAVQPPIPGSVISLYLAFVLLGIFLHITLDDGRIQRTLAFFVARRDEPPTWSWQRKGLLIIVPLILGWLVYTTVLPSYNPPAEIFQRHPTPPETVAAITVPEWAAEPARWEDRDIQRGKALYEGNCAICHGEKLDGQGPAAEGLRYPIRPANFRDPGTISQLTFKYVFWRVSEGGVQNQFNSAMPSWVAPQGQEVSTLHRYDLSPDEAWRIIMYLYKETGFQPRKE